MTKSEIFQPKVEASPENMLFRFSLGQALYEEGEALGSIEHLQKCADSRVDWMLPRILLGKALIENNRSQEAEAILKAALQLAVDQRHDEPAEELRNILADF